MNHTITLLYGLLFLSLRPIAILKAASKKQPNVLLITAGDLDYGNFAIHGNAHLQTALVGQ